MRGPFWLTLALLPLVVADDVQQLMRDVGAFAECNFHRPIVIYHMEGDNQGSGLAMSLWQRLSKLHKMRATLKSLNQSHCQMMAEEEEIRNKYV